MTNTLFYFVVLRKLRLDFVNLSGRFYHLYTLGRVDFMILKSISGTSKLFCSKVIAPDKPQPKSFMIKLFHLFEDGFFNNKRTWFVYLVTKSTWKIFSTMQWWTRICPVLTSNKKMSTIKKEHFYLSHSSMWFTWTFASNKLLRINEMQINDIEEQHLL